MAPKHLLQKAVCRVTACLDHLKIPYEYGTRVENVVVQKKGGGELQVLVVPAPSATPTVDLLEVLAPEVASSHRETADKAFHAITEAAGYGKPQAIDRGAVQAIPPGRKTNRPYGDDPDRVILRESVFRTVANPTTNVYQQMDPVIMTCCRFFWMKNQALCVRLGYDIGDLKTYAQMWTANFWSTGRVLRPKKDENERLLYRFLRQRFAEFYQQLRGARSRNVVADKQSIALGLGVDYLIDSDGMGDEKVAKAVSVPTEDLDEEEQRAYERYKDEHTDINTSNPKKRRASAAALLSKSLSAMPHDAMVEALTQTGKSYFACPDTRKEALRQLEIHTKSCSACTPSAEPVLPTKPAPVESLNVGLDESEDAAGVDALGAAEEE